MNVEPTKTGVGYEEKYTDRQACFDDLRIARKGWGHSRESDAAIHKTLGLMYIYCPNDIQDMVLANLEELDRRMQLCEEHGKYKG